MGYDDPIRAFVRACGCLTTSSGSSLDQLGFTLVCDATSADAFRPADKIADAVSDAIVDACLSADPWSKVSSNLSLRSLLVQ
jgi:hypothetical protein